MLSNQDVKICKALKHQMRTTVTNTITSWWHVMWSICQDIQCLKMSNGKKTSQVSSHPGDMLLCDQDVKIVQCLDTSNRNNQVCLRPDYTTCIGPWRVKWDQSPQVCQHPDYAIYNGCHIHQTRPTSPACWQEQQMLFTLNNMVVTSQNACTHAWSSPHPHTQKHIKGVPSWALAPGLVPSSTGPTVQVY